MREEIASVYLCAYFFCLAVVAYCVCVCARGLLDNSFLRIQRCMAVISAF